MSSVLRERNSVVEFLQNFAQAAVAADPRKVRDIVEMAPDHDVTENADGTYTMTRDQLVKVVAAGIGGGYCYMARRLGMTLAELKTLLGDNAKLPITAYDPAVESLLKIFGFKSSGDVRRLTIVIEAGQWVTLNSERYITHGELEQMAQYFELKQPTPKEKK